MMYSMQGRCNEYFLHPTQFRNGLGVLQKVKETGYFQSENEYRRRKSE